MALKNFQGKLMQTIHANHLLDDTSEISAGQPIKCLQIKTHHHNKWQNSRI